jgi:hypothetical protein
MQSALESALSSGDPKALQRAVFDLRDQRTPQGFIDDEVAFAVLAILRRREMASSPLAGHLLNFFEFEATRISQRAKDRCAAFLREWGDTFSHFHSQQVVAELRKGPYLVEEAPKGPRKKPRQS